MFKPHQVVTALSSAVDVNFFHGIQKGFLKQTTTNKPFLRPRQRSLVVKNFDKFTVNL